MIIRNSTKALLLRDNEILLNCCEFSDGTPYYDLPGGGQNPLEDIQASLLREIMEETGYIARIGRFAALTEEIYDDPEMHVKYPDFFHRILHIFIAHAVEKVENAPIELDFQSHGCRWFSIDEAETLPILPASLRGQLHEVIDGSAPVWLGTIHTAQKA